MGVVLAAGGSFQWFRNELGKAEIALAKQRGDDPYYLLTAEAALATARKTPVVGILNGVDYETWDPRHDRYLQQHYSAFDLQGKRANKQRLLDEGRLRSPIERPLIGMVSRLASQKGIDILMGPLPKLLGERDFGLIVLGSGEERYAAFFESLARRFAERVVFTSAHDE